MRLENVAVNSKSGSIFMLLTLNEIWLTNLKMIHIYFESRNLCIVRHSKYLHSFDLQMFLSDCCGVIERK